MKRIMMQVYVSDGAEAMKLYEDAFGGEVRCDMRDDDGNLIHGEIDVLGNIIAVSQGEPKGECGNTMQFCLHYDKVEETLIKRAYDILSIDGDIKHPLGECFYSEYMTDLIDKFGVHWCLFL